MAPVIISNSMTARLTYGRKMEALYIAKIHITGLSKQASQIHIYPKLKTAPLISLGILFDDWCTIKIDKQDMSVQKNKPLIIKGTFNKETVIREVPLETQQWKNLVNNILVRTSKTELSQCLIEEPFIPKTANLLKAIKQFFLKT